MSTLSANKVDCEGENNEGETPISPDSPASRPLSPSSPATKTLPTLELGGDEFCEKSETLSANTSRGGVSKPISYRTQPSYQPHYHQRHHRASISTISTTTSTNHPFCDIELQVTSDSGPASPHLPLNSSTHSSLVSHKNGANLHFSGHRNQFFSYGSPGYSSIAFDHYRRSSVGVEHLSSAAKAASAANGGGGSGGGWSNFWSTGTSWLSPISAVGGAGGGGGSSTSGFSHRRRSSHPKICTFDCAFCRKLMLGSASERNLTAIDSVSSLLEGSGGDGGCGTSEQTSQSLHNSDQHLSVLCGSPVAVVTSASSTPAITESGVDSNLEEKDVLTKSSNKKTIVTTVERPIDWTTRKLDCDESKESSDGDIQTRGKLLTFFNLFFKKKFTQFTVNFNTVSDFPNKNDFQTKNKEAVLSTSSTTVSKKDLKLLGLNNYSSFLNGNTNMCLPALPGVPLPTPVDGTCGQGLGSMKLNGRSGSIEHQHQLLQGTFATSGSDSPSSPTSYHSPPEGGGGCATHACVHCGVRWNTSGLGSGNGGCTAASVWHFPSEGTDPTTQNSLEQMIQRCWPQETGDRPNFASLKATIHMLHE